MLILPAVLLLYYGFYGLFYLHNQLMGALSIAAVIWFFKKRNMSIMLRGVVIVGVWVLVVVYIWYPKPVTHTVMNLNLIVIEGTPPAPLYGKDVFYCSGIPYRSSHYAACVGRSYYKDGTPRPAYLDFYPFIGRRAELPM